MEASRRLRLEASFSMAFGLVEGESRLSRPHEVALVDDLLESRADLHAQLAAVVTESRLPFAIEIERVEIRSGSIIVDIYAVLLGVGSSIGNYGQLRQGLNEIARDLQTICERFLGQRTPNAVYPQQAGWSVLPSGGPPPPAPRSRQDSLLTYLLLSHGVLMATLIGITIVLLVQG